MSLCPRSRVNEMHKRIWFKNKQKSSKCLHCSPGWRKLDSRSWTSVLHDDVNNTHVSSRWHLRSSSCKSPLLTQPPPGGAQHRERPPPQVPPQSGSTAEVATEWQCCPSDSPTSCSGRGTSVISHHGSPPVMPTRT